MPQLIHLESTPRTRDGSLGITGLVERQGGVISRTQLLTCGLSTAGLARWIAAGRLHRLHPGVYAVGHRALTIEGRLVAALLYAGSKAALSHTTAGWWWQILKAEPQRIHVSGPGRRRSIPEVCVHRPRHTSSTIHRDLPVTTLARTLLDLAATVSSKTLRRALAEADYRRLLDVADLEQALQRGRPGVAALRRALVEHDPRLARALSVLEERFIALCERNEIPPPAVNARVVGLMVDALWAQQRVIVELDGHAAHATPAAIERDRHRDLALRAAGYRVHRYTRQQITERPDQVVTDLRAALDGGSIPLPHRR